MIIYLSRLIHKTLKPVLSKSNFITLHLPKIGEKAIIGAEEIGLMKTGAGIINTSRGGIIDETALMFALDKQKGLSICRIRCI